MSDVRLTHVGGPTTLIEVEVRATLTDPTFDAPGRKCTSAGGRRRARSQDRRSPFRPFRRSTRCCSPTTTTATTWTSPAVSGSTGWDCDHDGPRRPTSGRRGARARALGHGPPRSAGTADDRGHGHTLPARPPAEGWPVAGAVIGFALAWLHGDDVCVVHARACPRSVLSGSAGDHQFQRPIQGCDESPVRPVSAQVRRRGAATSLLVSPSARESAGTRTAPGGMRSASGWGGCTAREQQT